MRPIPTAPMLERCEKCERETRHEPDKMGAYHCTVCAATTRRAANKSSGRWLLLAALGVAVLFAIVIGYVQCRSQAFYK